MTAPSVSFLCTAYRTEDTVVQTLESVRAQTRTDWQVVVVDNGPSDELAAVVAPYLEDPRFLLVRQDNARAAGGVNAAARVATGRYVAVLHTDDLVTPTFVERLVPVMDAQPDLQALSTDAFYLRGTGLRSETYRERTPERFRGGQVTLLQLIEGWVPYYTALVRRETWDRIGGFRHDAQNVEDVALWVDLLVGGHRFEVLEEPLAVYREDDDSDSRGAAGVEVMEESWERVLAPAVRDHGTAEERAAFAEALARSRHRRATVRARRLLLDGDHAGAREAARAAAAEQSDLRTRLTALLMTLSPTLLGAVYRSFKAGRRAVLRLRARVLGGQRSDERRLAEVMGA